MLCKEAVHCVPRYRSGELEPTLKRQVEEHLRACTVCNALLSQEAELDSTIREAVIRTSPHPSRVRKAVLDEIYSKRARKQTTKNT
jgi:predicted anti-sigma-YlaC factor YlaD